MTSAENSVSEPPNLKIFGGRIHPDPPTWLVPSALVKVPPLQKPSYGPKNHPQNSLSNNARSIVKNLPSSSYKILFSR